MKSRKPRPPHTLATELSVAFLSLCAAFLLIACGLEMVFSFQAEREIVAARQYVIAQRAAHEVAGFITEKRSVLYVTAKLGNIGTGTPEEREKGLLTLMGLHPSFRQVVLLGPGPRVLTQTSRLSRLRSEDLLGHIDSSALSGLKEGRDYIGPVYVDAVTNEPMIIIVVPVEDLLGNYLGALIAEVNLKFMWRLVDQIKIGERGLAYVVDREADLIALGDIARVIGGENLGHLKAVAEFVNSPTLTGKAGVTISRGINGTLTVGTHVPLGTPDWAVVTEIPLREAYGPLLWGAARSAGVLLLMTVLAGLLGVYLARRLARPILTLKDTAVRIAEGDTQYQAVLEGPSEVISLAKAFNHMTARLHEMLRREEQRSRKLQQQIMQRKEAEKDLRKSQQKYLNIFETASVSLWEEDVSELRSAIERLKVEGVNDFRHYLETHPEFAFEAIKMIRVTDVNDEALRTYGVPDKARFIEAFDTLVFKESPHIFKEILIAIAEGRTRLETEAVNRTLKGDRIHVLAKLTIPRKQDRFENMLVSSMDITARKRAEDELTRYREHLEELVSERTSALKEAQDQLLKKERLAVLGQLTATVSHELRNPLGVIRSSVFYLQRRLSGAEENTAKYLQRIDEQVSICDTIVEELLLYTRGRVAEKIRGDINGWLTRLVADYAEHEGIGIDQRPAADLPAVPFDPEKMRRVIVNLLNNAVQSVKAREEKETSDRTPYQAHIAVGTAQDADAVVIDVEDNGIGMNEETLQKALDPLFTTRARGTGLGLAIVDKTVREHGGTVSMKSRVNEGTRVRIRLPLSEGGP